MSEQTTALTVADRAKQALAVTKTEEELKALAAGTVTITAITNADGRQQVHAARMVLKNKRIDIQKRGKDARDEATKFSKAVIVEEDQLIALIEPEEKRLGTLQDAWDDAIEAEKQAKVAAEQKRVADLQERVAEIRGNRMLSPTSGSELIAEHISDLEGDAVDDSFEEFREQAEAAKAEGLAWLRNVHAAAVAHEAEQARIKAEREELAKLRAEQAERDRVAAIERKALADKQAAEAAAERARIAEEERQAKAARDAEAAKQAEELRLMRVAQETAAAAERQRIAQEEAAAKAIRDAEAKKLADERAELETQQAEVKREQARIESLSGGNPSEKSASSPADDRGIEAARSSEGGNVGTELPDVTIQSREPVDSNPVSGGAGEHGAIDTRSVLTLRHSVIDEITKPSDAELLSVLARHYNVPTSKVIEWLLAVDFTSMENAA